MTVRAAKLSLLRRRQIAQLAASLPVEAARVRGHADDGLARRRERRLRQLLTIAQRSSSWHRARLGGLDPEYFGLENLRRIPPMTRADLEANWDRVVTVPSVDRRAVIRRLEGSTQAGRACFTERMVAVQTSGTTSAPVPIVWDHTGWRRLGAVASRRTLGRGGHGWTSRRRVLGLFGASAGQVSVASALFWSSPLVPIRVIPADTPAERIAELLVDLRVTEVHGYPSALIRTGRWLTNHSIETDIDEVAASGEPLLPSVAAELREHFGAPVRNRWGATEVGWVASSDLNGGPMNIELDAAIVEAVDEVDNEVTPGTGSSAVLVTGLLNRAMPLIRYRIDDAVVLDGYFADARQVTVLGRTADTFRYRPSSVSIAVPSVALAQTLSEFRELRDYRVSQTERGAVVEVDVAPSDDGLPDRLRDAVAAQLDRHGLPRAEVAVRPVSALLPASPGKKLARFVPLTTLGADAR